MKCIVETTGSFMLVDPVYGDIIWADRPCVILWSSFFEARTGKGEIRVLVNDLPAEATDGEFVEYLKDAENADLAIASYATKFVKLDEAVEPPSPAEPAPVEPAPAEPAPVEPAPAEPAPKPSPKPKAASKAKD